MFPINNKTFIFMMVVLFSQVTGIAQIDTTSNWKLSKDKSGIRIYTRTMVGSKFKEYKVNTIIDATPEELIDILKDVESYLKWMAYIKEARLLEKEGENKFYVLEMFPVPWPFDNRDEITLSEVIRYPDSDIIEIAITIIPNYLPENKGIVRMPSGSGLWIFTPLGNGKTEVCHRFGGDPGGKIPAWIVNMFLVDGPYKTMLGLQEMVIRER